MPRDLPKEGERWINQAREDMRAAECLAEQEIHYAACFFCQQAVEKALKGVLLVLGNEPGRTHSVAELCQELESTDSKWSELSSEIGFLDQYYLPSRYPDALPGGIPAEAFTIADSERALKAGRRVMAAAVSPQDLPDPAQESSATPQSGPSSDEDLSTHSPASDD